MSFKLADTEHMGIGRVIELPQAPGSAYELGALLLVNGSAQFAECGADPASIAAVALSGAGTDASGFNILAVKGFPPGYMQAAYIKNRKFRARYVGALPAADGGVYGVVKDSDGLWKVDFTDTIATRVKVVGRLTNSPENLPEVLVTFLDANVQAYN